MSIQTTTVINGMWTTRTVDIHHVLAQNREPRQQERAATQLEPLQRPPLLGVLTQTIIRSPVAKWIIPARIRHESKNDVIFIYENYVEIKDVNQDLMGGPMGTLAVKADFDSSIRSAKIFGMPRKYTAPAPEGVDAVVKKEEVEDENYGNLRPELPPHILVLALESRMLAFVFGFHDGVGPVQFLQCRRPLPVGQSSLEQLGEHLAVDPKAMAVAAYEGSFALYALKSMDEIRGAVQGNGAMCESRFQPVKQERHIRVEGRILKMEFLHPPEGQGTNNRVILLLVISQDQRSELVCYEWNCNTNLATASPIGSGQRLRSDEQLPLLLVPLTKSTAFLLVSEKRITGYKNILTGNATARTLLTCNHEPSEEIGSSQRPPIWTQWARPSRHDLHLQNQDNIYLCREDGVVQFLEIKDAVQMLDCTHRVGKLGVNVNTSFASIDLGCKGSDLLVVSGDESDGGGWLFEARRDANKSFVIPNWTSMVDFASTDDVEVVGAYSRQSATRPNPNKFPKRLFAGTGRGSKHGGVTEIRIGIEGIKQTNLESYCDIPQIGVTQIWVLDGFAEDLILILLSYPTHTSLFQIGAKGVIQDVMENDHVNIDFDAKTIAAGATRNGLIIQITESSFRAVFYGLNVESFYQQVIIIAACVRICEDEPNKALLLIVCRSENVQYLHLGRFELDGEGIKYLAIGAPYPLPVQPTFVSLERVGLEFLAFVGTVASTLQVFRIHPDLGLRPTSEYKFEGIFAVCDTVAVLNPHAPGDNKRLILCGLRNGHLEVLRWNPELLDNHLLAPHEKLQIGNTSITVLTDSVKTSRAILLCDQKLYTLEQPFEDSLKVQVPLIVNNVYLTDPELPSFQHGKINALAQSISGFSEGLVFCVEGNQIHLASLSLDAESSLIPRRIPIGGTPKRVKYSPKLHKLIVLFYSTHNTQVAAAAGRHNRTDQRWLKYSIALVDMDAQPDLDESHLESSVISNHFKPDEIALGVTEWFPQGNNGDHHVLVVNTVLHNLPPRQPSGRICLFSASAAGVLTLKKAVEKEAPVHALISYGSNSLLYSCGTDLCLQTLSTTSNSSGWKFQDFTKFALLSQVRHISIHESLIYVSTSGNSLLVLKVEENKLVLHFNDDIARDNLFHVTIPERSLVLTSQTGRMITGLWQPSKKKGTTSVSTVFEAQLPGSITRFRQINRPPWKQFRNPENLDTAVGSTTDGTLIQFNVLDENEWRLLAFIQTLALRSPDICPFVNDIGAHRRPLEPSPTNPLDMHINGDILRRLLERGRERSLIKMMSYEYILKILLAHDHILGIVLAQHPRDDAIYLGSNPLDPRTRMATELARRETQARQNCMVKFAQGVGLAAATGEELVAKVLQWMIQLMQKIL